MNDRHEILRYLDNVTNKIETEDRKRATKEKEIADKEAQKLIKNYKKVQAKAEEQANKKEKKRQEWEKKNVLVSNGEGNDASAAAGANPGGPVTFSAMVGLNSAQQNPTRGGVKGSYASMVGTVKSKMMGTVFKKMAKDAGPVPQPGDLDRRGSTMSVMSVSTVVGADGAPVSAAPGTFKVISY